MQLRNQRHLLVSTRGGVIPVPHQECRKRSITSSYFRATQTGYSTVCLQLNLH
nr:unnamed protein product [Callosobruchus analis]